MDSFEISLNNHHADDLNGLFVIGSDNYDQLKHAIEREFRHHGAPEITHMEFDRINYNPTTGKGSFRVVLDVNFTFGCEDLLVPKKAQTSEWTFEAKNDKATFYSSPFTESAALLMSFD